MERRPANKRKRKGNTMFDFARAAVADFIAPELKHERRALERAANYDALTNVANRRAYELAIGAAEADQAIAIVVFDVNNFGLLNKRIGHAFGDQVLKEIAASIVGVARMFKVTERVFRPGGDEFVAFVPVAFAEVFRDRCESSFGVRYPGIDVRLVGTVGQTFSEADALLQERKGSFKK